MSTNQNYEIKEVGVFTPKMVPQPRLNAGDVGYFIANIKSTADIKIWRHFDRFSTASIQSPAWLSGSPSHGL